MYRLLPWKFVGSALTFIIFLAVYVDVLEMITGIKLPDHMFVRCLSGLLIFLLTAIFCRTDQWAPWRWIWRCFPSLNNRVFPDINGIWIGSTNSNWPVIKKMFEASQSDYIMTQEALSYIPLQTDAMAVEIKATLFKVQITASLSSTNSQSHSITVCPRMEAHNRLHLTYVYEQGTPNPSLTDADNHLGTADLVINMDNISKAEGSYWTRRSWRRGLNTAGLIKLRRIRTWKEKSKSLCDYAAEEQRGSGEERM